MPNSSPCVVIYAPRHEYGTPSRYYWEVIQGGVSVSCGSTPDRSEAVECAELALAQAEESDERKD